jgi:hypothetical protein
LLFASIVVDGGDGGRDDDVDDYPELAATHH